MNIISTEKKVIFEQLRENWDILRWKVGSGHSQMTPKILNKGKLLGPKKTVTGNWSPMKEGRTIESENMKVYDGVTLQMSYGNYI